jgi:hypothetical protein
MTTLLENVLSDLKHLRVSYERRGLLRLADSARLGSAGAPSALARDLLLADALLRNVVGAPGASERPFQYTVFGGTQVGKSTVINVLAGRDVAQVHHTAGFTRHAQGFAAQGISPEEALAPFPRAFPGFEQVPRDLLSLERPREFALETLTYDIAMPASVLWDSPDCDAVDSSLFQQGFVESLTLADAVVYVTSREKYAVNAILAWVVRLHAAGVPVVCVLNMTPLVQQAELIADMRAAIERVAEADLPAGSPAPSLPIIAFEYVADGDTSALYDPAYGPAGELRSQVARAASEGRQDERARRANALDWIVTALPSILEPALRDLDAWEQWNQALDQSLRQFVDDYRRFYLDDPNRYDAFSRVGLEILELLNPPIPGLQKTLTVVRTVVSLPARALLAGGKAAYRFASSGGQSFSAREVVPHELATYREAHNRLLNDLARYVEQRRRAAADSREENFWPALDAGWEDQVPVIEEEFRQALTDHRARTDQYIRDAAQGIYKELARDPVKLNILRSSRIAADAAAIVVSIKTGGPGDIVHDLVVAPALMSVVEAATRQIAGSYVDQRKAELRESLVKDTKRFAGEVYGDKLRDLAARALEKIGLQPEDAENIRSLDQRVRKLREEIA